jgi:hypothetical protein
VRRHRAFAKGKRHRHAAFNLVVAGAVDRGIAAIVPSRLSVIGGSGFA